MKRTVCFLIVLVTVISLQAFGQGSLSPTGGPIPMMKTLAQVESRAPITNLPYTITQSGSYYFTGDLTCASPTGIYINADSVSIDMCGYTMTGPGVTASSAIKDSVGQNRTVKIRNGCFRNWISPNRAVIDLGDLYSGLLSDLVVDGCGQGIDVANAVVRDCIVTDCQYSGGNFFGITARKSLVRDCIVKNSEALAGRGFGISVDNSVVRDCLVVNVTGTSGAIGIQAQSSLVKDCHVTECGDGVSAHSDSIVQGCLLNANTNSGIDVAYGACRIQDNHLVGNTQYGVISMTSTNNIIVGNTATDNGGSFFIMRGVYGPLINASTPAGYTITNNPLANFYF